jgi:hypothetical protein
VRAALLALLAAACAPALPPPLARVITMSPSGVVAPDAVTVEIAFSAPLDRAWIEGGRWFALCRQEDLRDVLRAIESEEGLGSAAPVVAARVELIDGGTRAILRPEGALTPEQSWAAVLSSRVRSADGRPVVDAEGKARSVAVLFATGPNVDRAAPRPRWVLPPHGPVPSNVAAGRSASTSPCRVPSPPASPARRRARSRRSCWSSDSPRRCPWGRSRSI